MKSPIARGLLAAARLTEWAHRRIHGPKFAPGDVVETERGTFTLDCRESYGWGSTCGSRIYENAIIRVVRYGEGE